MVPSNKKPQTLYRSIPAVDILLFVLEYQKVRYPTIGKIHSKIIGRYMFVMREDSEIVEMEDYLKSDRLMSS